MLTFTCNQFRGHYPVGTAAVITAFSKEQAKEFLEIKLKLIGLEQEIDINTLEELDTKNFISVKILCDGDY